MKACQPRSRGPQRARFGAMGWKSGERMQPTAQAVGNKIGEKPSPGGAKELLTAIYLAQLRVVTLSLKQARTRLLVVLILRQNVRR
jgi:hypothetical protein